MLQRIQSIWLLVVAACAFASLKQPIYTGMDGAVNIRIDGTTNFFIMLITIAIGVMALITIFLYNNRILQIRLCLLAILLEVLNLFLYSNQIEKLTNGTYALASILQLGILFLLFLAIKGIRKDDKIVKESNRLR